MAFGESKIYLQTDETKEVNSTNQNRWIARCISQFILLFFFFFVSPHKEMPNSQSHYLISQKDRNTKHNKKQRKNETKKGSKLIFLIFKRFLFHLNSMMCALYCAMRIKGREKKRKKLNLGMFALIMQRIYFLSIGTLKSSTFTHLQTENERYLKTSDS